MTHTEGTARERACHENRGAFLFRSGCGTLDRGGAALLDPWVLTPALPAPAGTAVALLLPLPHPRDDRAASQAADCFACAQMKRREAAGSMQLR